MATAGFHVRHRIVVNEMFSALLNEFPSLLSLTKGRHLSNDSLPISIKRA